MFSINPIGAYPRLHQASRTQQASSIPVDYDTTAIATTYDAARGYRPETLRLWLELVAEHVPFAPRLIVDLGCGTGRFTQALADRFQAQAIGIDPSQRMLAAAQAKLAPNDRRVQFQCASAEQLPLANACADVIFMSMVLHHVRDKPATARECRRILRDGGCLCVRNATRNTLYPQSRFFPGMLAMMHADLPTDADVIALFEAAGLRSCAHQPVQQAIATSWRELADKLALRADSFLARLPDAEFEAGIGAMRAYAEGRPPEDIMEQVDFFVFERS
jgi:ubiquinone/menaquinone biosynthesis C-methylase UbiE